MENILENRRKNSTPNGLTVMSQIYVSHAKNSIVWSTDGKRYIDFASGTSTMNVGHSHPKVIDAIQKQCVKFTHTFFQQLPYESYISLAEKLNEIVPGNFRKKTALFTDGAGAIENAIKIAKVYTGRSGVITFHGCFHGRTLLTASMAGKNLPYKNGLGTPVSELYQIPFPSEVDSITLEDTKKSLEQLFKHIVEPKRIAAILIEPVQGEGGIRPASKELMQHIRNVCDKNDIVMIADEVQTAFGRTGTMFAMEQFDVSADITVMSKSIAAGIPLSAVTGKLEIMDSPSAGGIGGTYNGNPIACAVSHAVLNIIQEENLLEKSKICGLYVLNKLSHLKNEYNEVVDVRSFGSMIAIEFLTREITLRIQCQAREKGLILITSGIEGNVIRILYPLTITQDHLNEGLNILLETIEKICKNEKI